MARKPGARGGDRGGSSDPHPGPPPKGERGGGESRAKVAPSVADVPPAQAPGRPNPRIAVVVVSVRHAGADERKPVANERPEMMPIPEGKSIAAQPHGVDRGKAAGMTHGGMGKPSSATKPAVSHPPVSAAAESAPVSTAAESPATMSAAAVSSATMPSAATVAGRRTRNRTDGNDRRRRQRDHHPTHHGAPPLLRDAPQPK
jgi:hypothetical protein